MLKIASWNVNSLKIRLPQVLDWLAKEAPDFLALQETKVTDEVFPEEAICQAGYQVVFRGQKTYNGVALLSKQPVTEVESNLPTFADTQQRLLAATYGSLRLLNLYVPNGAVIGSEKYQYKLNWFHALQLYLKDQLLKYEQVIVLGDFNIAPDDRDVHDPKAWEGSVLVSPPEREALQNLLKLGLVDSFRLFAQGPELYSWWDYRAASFQRNRGLRIDLILISKNLVKYCRSSQIDKIPRNSERPSDHTPVMAVLEI
ncbi:MAG: exodeoxyribonuclease III [Gammaproteobacteria bacterium RIFCSPHIGHO2_12_FULL_35_23]|nr:MAG: exodeoxyribonuclease III [Gammaproteobacteria bacterium RIFCSPHIGHO2_12_FULL_35_23]